MGSQDADHAIPLTRDDVTRFGDNVIELRPGSTIAPPRRVTWIGPVDPEIVERLLASMSPSPAVSRLRHPSGRRREQG